MEWVDLQSRRGVRERSIAHAPPTVMGLLPIEQRDLLMEWVRKDNETRGREALLKEAGRQRIELAEALCDWLLREGWISRKERLSGGQWHWLSLNWRDLAALKRLLGVGSRSQRDEERARLLVALREWRGGITSNEISVDQGDLLVDVDAAIASLESEISPRVEILDARSRWLKALHGWALDEMQGTRRDFALYAGGHTKSIGTGDWKWLEERFDLERLGVSHFTPLMWLAGNSQLQWGERTVDLGAAGFMGLPLDDLSRVSRLDPAPQYWWLVENRTSFERLAQQLEEGALLVWLPGRPSIAWLSALEHLAQRASAPLRVSADADPAGVDIACTVGQVWERLGLGWTAHRMGAADLIAAGQPWALNAHDRTLLARLLSMPNLPQSLRELCEVMARDGLKAEQEGWL